ncbi:MAG: MBL fold metallo-hydrolase [Actinomycetia bacterium]|nr:MBL fold metallo-hydrolase [Actinomycetes bacterium]
MANHFPASFDNDDANVATGPQGQIAHRGHLTHTERLERRLWAPRPGVWSVVGNGLSNQNFIEGPEGLICVDTGESNQEMAWSLTEVRKHTDAPVVAVLYTHFHYVGGTRAVFDEAGEVPIWGHTGIEGNLQRIGGEVSAAAQRGLVHQMAILMPTEGPDATVNLGLGKEFRHPDHAPYTREVLLPTETFDEAVTLSIAGLIVEVTPAPSDADDSVTFWFPELGVAVNNILWPALFNVFAIRGEEYRDPRALLTGLDHLASLGADHLVGTHGPPISGAERIAQDIEEYRDSIQFMWDQTVRGLNRGLTVDELTQSVQLPDPYQRTYLTHQYYGLVEHHVRQIHAGLRGWFDGHEALLFPVPPIERVQKLIAGFGGAVEVRAQAHRALDDGDLRWALELATWLVRGEVDGKGRIDGGTAQDRSLLASVLRAIAQRTTSANARNWCLTRALELDGLLDLGRFRVHRFGRGEVLANPPEVYVRALRVVLDPERAEGVNEHLRWEFADGTRVGVHVRRQVAVPTDGSGAELAIGLDLETWAEILAGKLTLTEAVASGAVRLSGDEERVLRLLGSFDHPTLGV